MIDHLQSILTQDNRCTDSPLYAVFGHERIFTDPNYSEDGDCVYIEHESGDYSELTEEEFNELSSDPKSMDPYWTDDKFDPNRYERHTYKLVPVFETACFTEKSAQDYINCNGHNISGRRYKKPYIYVESGYRNKEWQDIRKFLIDKAQVESNSVSI